MDFGVVGLEGFIGSETATGFSSLGSDHQETNQKSYGSGGLFKQERSCNNEDELRSSKLAKIHDDFSCYSKPLMFHHRNTLLRSNASIFFDEQEEQQMLSFSAPKPDALSVDRSSKNVTFPHIYLTAMGWGAFQLGFSNNTDPEPGRCRRTDGKKWRCSRDAVAGQKYCERHMNRGRHRSRKPVEGQPGHSVTATAATTSKLMPNVSSSSASAVGPVGGSGEPNSLTSARQKYENLQLGGTSNLSAAASLNRSILNKDTVGEKMPYTAAGLSMISPNGDLKSKENPFLIPKQPISYEENLRNGFGVVSSGELNPSHKSSSMINSRNFGSSQDLTSQETDSQQSFRRFIDDRPKSQSHCSAISWPELDVQSYRTQLSISIPMAASDFTSTTSSPNNENLTSSPLRLSREFDPINIGLGVGNVVNESNQKQANWIPVSWGTSIGGPLGEALHSNGSTMVDLKNLSILNLMTEGSENSPLVGSSPTGVLQKTTFASLSNSSAGSSPENNKTHEGVSHCNDLLGSNLVESSSLPAT
ncbi:hypothetical protein E1A91_D05G283700v1 [Gossypium mustelinum]|uniref:Growth-regulating factor n=1 Tax=Gossypium mustelinum TaxID=34275 RepID=A0A5D2V1T0_GOSMU|nr:hypothetical protein E1A91_D05G283700v1 [Gossypium mustelinum]